MLNRIIYAICFVLLLPSFSVASYGPVSFTDSAGVEVKFTERPCRVVSLVPSVSEMIMKLGAGSCLLATTHHSVLPSGIAEKDVIGGFSQPDLNRVASIRPDLIFYSSLQKGVAPLFGGKVQLVNLHTASIAESFDHIRLLGRIFEKEAEAETIITEQQHQLRVMARKTALIPMEKRKRTMRLMGRSRIMTPGDDSFQREYIEAAGGIPPRLGRNGAITTVSLKEWQNFNPQVLYGCGGDRGLLEYLQTPGWRDVEAVKNNAIYFYPCDLTCRVATNSGFFVSWLGANIYQHQFGNSDHYVLPEKVVARKSLDLDIPYVTTAELIESDIKDFRNRTVLLTFEKPMTVLSTLEGWREGVVSIGNHYFPPPSWGLGHEQGLEGLREQTSSVLGVKEKNTSLLFTGADMSNLAIIKKVYRDMEVTALVTAGVAGNAVRTGEDSGLFYEPDSQPDPKKPGTINILLLTNMELSPRAMTRAVVAVTEAKSAAMQDLDIRSSYTGLVNPASGTGTDNVLVVQGRGGEISNSGGHTKMGELIGRAVYRGVQEAIFKQNGFTNERSVFQRLRERKINLHQISSQYLSGAEGSAELEKLLLIPQFSSFLQAALAISDAYENGLVNDLSAFEVWCHSQAVKIGGKERVNPVMLDNQTFPKVVKKALEALLTGLATREGV